jgi:hypothetical protein
MDLLPRLPLEEKIGLRCIGGFCEQTLFRAFAPEMVERLFGGDPPRPAGEVFRPELLAPPVEAASLVSL